MKDYDFGGLKIVNTHVALNSHFFCVGMVGDFKPSVDSKSRKNDKRSILGIFRFNLEDNTCSIEQWIN